MQLWSFHRSPARPLSFPSITDKDQDWLIKIDFYSTEMNISQLRITTSPLFHFSIDIWIWNSRETCCLPCVTSRLTLSASNCRLMVFHAAQPLYNLGRGLPTPLAAQSGSTSRPAGETVYRTGDTFQRWLLVSVVQCRNCSIIVQATALCIMYYEGVCCGEHKRALSVF